MHIRKISYIANPAVGSPTKVTWPNDWEAWHTHVYTSSRKGKPAMYDMSDSGSRASFSQIICWFPGVNQSCASHCLSIYSAVFCVYKLPIHYYQQVPQISCNQFVLTWIQVDKSLLENTIGMTFESLNNTQWNLSYCHIRFYHINGPVYTCIIHGWKGIFTRSMNI